MTWWRWCSTERMTVGVRVLDGRIVETPPIVRRFLGQPEDNLVRWLSRQPGFLTEAIRD